MLGWLPGADGGQAGLRLRRPRGHRTRDVSADRFPGLRAPRPRPLVRGRPRRVQRRRVRRVAARGRERRVSRSATTRPTICRSTGRRRPQWTVCDRYFSPIMAADLPQPASTCTAAQTDRLDNTFDDLHAADDLGPPGRRRALTGRYYFSDVPFLALWGGKYLPITRHLSGVPRGLRQRHTAARSRSWNRASLTRTSGCPTTIIRTPTSATARSS